MQNILQRIKSVQNGESVSSFARKIGVKQQTLDCYLKEKRKLSLELVVCICSKLGVSSDWLLGLNEPVTASALSTGTQADAAKDAEIARLRERVAALEFALNAIGGRASAPAARSTAGASRTA